MEVRTGNDTPTTETTTKSHSTDDALTTNADANAAEEIIVSPPPLEEPSMVNDPTPVAAAHPMKEMTKSKESNVGSDRSNNKNSSQNRRTVVPSPKISMAMPYPANYAAAKGDLKKLKRLMILDKNSIYTKDKNGWLPIHEASRSGQTEILRYILEMVDLDDGNYDDMLNSVSNFGHGKSPLRIAQDYLGESHDTCVYLRSIGAMSIGPELQPEL